MLEVFPGDEQDTVILRQQPCVGVCLSQQSGFNCGSVSWRNIADGFTEAFGRACRQHPLDSFELRIFGGILHAAARIVI